MLIFDHNPQGSEGWIEARRGVITASRFKDARDRLKNGAPSGKCLGYAYDVARERVGGIAPGFAGNQYTRKGQEQEPLARMAYEIRTGYLVEERGFAYTPDRKFGVSVDGDPDPQGLWECKTMVSSERVFACIVDGDVSDYRDQCVGAMWLMHRQWCDLTLWAPDLDEPLHIVRIQRDEAEIEALVKDLLAFDQMVNRFADRLRAKLGVEAEPGAPWLGADPEPTPAPAKPAEQPAAARTLAVADF